MGKHRYKEWTVRTVAQELVRQKWAWFSKAYRSVYCCFWNNA